MLLFLLFLDAAFLPLFAHAPKLSLPFQKYVFPQDRSFSKSRLAPIIDFLSQNRLALNNG
jgi:hypothetical protein